MAILPTSIHFTFFLSHLEVLKLLPETPF